MERLDKFLCDSGIGTRSQVKQLLKAGRVTVDGKTATDGRMKLGSEQQICLDGESLTAEGQVVVMLNKPEGFITATQDPRERTVMELLEPGLRGIGLNPVGRLDMDSEGLLLFTNDGDFANALMHPRQEVQKTYEVWVSGYLGGVPDLLRRPITLDGALIRPP